MKSPFDVEYMHVCGNIYFASLSNFETFVCHQACAGALRALGLSLADSAPTQQWCGGRLFSTAAGFLFYKNGCFLETKSRTIKVQNRPSCRGLQTGHRRNPRSYSKKTDFQAKIRPRISSRKPTEADDNPALPYVYNDDNDFSYIQSLSNML